VGPVTCLSFGPQRKEMYPEHFFCHGCDLYEDAVAYGIRNRANRNQRKYRCTGAHNDSSHPTTLRNEYRPRQHTIFKSPDSHEENLVDTSGGGKNAATHKECQILKY
jgi:hypothetical protein